MLKKLCVTLTTLSILFYFGISSSSLSQDINSTLRNDSMYLGKVCKVILFNGFEAVGKISYLTADSMRLKSELTVHKILVKDIKYILKPDEDVSVREDTEVIINEISSQGNDIDILSEECDVYLADKSLLKDVNLLFISDTTAYAIKYASKRELLISDIRKIVFKPVAPFWKGYLIGSAVGFAAVFIPSIFIKGEGHPSFGGPGFGAMVGLVVSIPSGLLGGIINSFLAADEVYNFEPGYSLTKYKRLVYIIKNHPKN